MEIFKYRLHCSKCNPSRFVEVHSGNVEVTADLEKDEYIFSAICPECDHRIINKRPMK